MWTFGLRGIFGKDIFPEYFMKIGNSFSFWKEPNELVLGYDVRLSTDALKTAFMSGVLSGGKNIIDLGIVPTPVVQFACKYFRTYGAVITASHNPPQFNGLKLLDVNGIGLLSEDIQKLFSIKNRILSPGTIRSFDVLPIYIRAVKKQVNIKGIEAFVVCDTCNSTMSRVVPEVLGDIGCKVFSINAHLDGRFPGRNPEPTEENLHELSEIVSRTGADFGVGYDSDGDRAVFVDRKGNVIPGDETFALIVKHELQKFPEGTVVTTVATSSIIDEIAEEFGARVIRTKVGDPVVTRALLKHKGLIGGEENGGVIYPKFNLGRDGILTTLKVLEIISSTGKRLDILIKKLPKYHRFKVKKSVENRERIMNIILRNERSKGNII
jgi:phosphomannomutase/phosphoglucomutase